MDSFLQSQSRRHGNDNRPKDRWDKIAAITPLVLGLIVTGGAAIFGYLHNARQDKLAEIAALEKLEPKLTSEEPGDHEFAYTAFAALGYGDLALRLIRLRNDENATDVVNSIKNVDSNLTEQADATLKELQTNCPDQITDITGCPDEGCGAGQFDPELNKRKNIRSNNQQPTLRTFQWLANLPDPKNFTRGNADRSELVQLGEGQKITVVAYALAVKKEGKETCNCGLTATKDTDNHIVLVDPSLRGPTLAANEKDSESAEFTPRVRLDHKNFTQMMLERLIDPDWRSGGTPKKGRLLVRVTGVLMFDSDHLQARRLKRRNNWEIHPVLKMEYCPNGEICGGGSNEKWEDLDNLQESD